MRKSPPRRTRAESKEENRQALLASAREIMLRDGYENTVLDEVAERAGLTKGAIYSIFGGKAELLRAIAAELLAAHAWPELDSITDPSLSLADQADRYAQRWARGALSATPLEEHAFLTELMAVTLRDPELFDDNAREMTAQRDALARAFAGRRTPAGNVTTERQAEAFASAFAGLMQGLASRSTYNPPELSERLFRDAAAALCTMVDAS